MQEEVKVGDYVAPDPTTPHLHDNVVGTVVAPVDDVSSDGETTTTRQGYPERGLGPHDDHGEDAEANGHHPIHPVPQFDLPIPLYRKVKE